MFKNILLLIISVTAGALLIILGFLWVSPRNTQILKIILPQSLFSLEKAPTDSLTGEIASLSGKVAWQSRIAPVAILINSPLKLQQGEEVDTYSDGNATINFPEIATISASFDTQINYIQTLPGSFVVWQKQGSADYTKTGGIPVSIIALDLLINVGSGESSILVDKDTSKVTVSVKSGLVTAAFNDSSNNTNVVSVKSGKIYVFDDNRKTGVIKKL
jgi:hypothetical protein